MVGSPRIARAGREPGVYYPDATATSVAWVREHEPAHARDAYRLAVSTDGRSIAVASKTGHVTVHDADGAMVAQFLHAAPSSAVAVTGLAFVGGRSLVSAGADGELRIYDLASGTKTALVRTPSPVYGLTAASDSRFAGIARTPEGDRLHVWDLTHLELVYQGPVFKIASFYLTVTVATGWGSGCLAHGDRTGSLHVYTPDDESGYVHERAATTHGDFCAVAFLGDSIVTAGEQVLGLTSWNPAPLGKRLDFPLPAPATWLCLWDEGSLLAVAKDGRMQRVFLRADPRTIGAGTLSDVRDVVGPDEALVAQAAVNRDRAAAASIVEEVRRLLTRHDHAAAESRILELEELGFVSEALQLFAEMYRGQRNLLGELRSLFTIVSEIPPELVPIDVLDRAAFLFEAVHEPELAALVLAYAAGDRSDDERVQRIVRLRPRFLAVPDGAARVAVAGLPDYRREPLKTIEAAVLEVQKSEALRRYFDNDVVFLQSSAEDVRGIVAIEDLRTVMGTDALSADLIGETAITPVVWKRGKHLGQSEQVLQIAPPAGRGLDGIAFWLTLESRAPGMRLTTFGVYQPGTPDRALDWNQRQSDRIVRYLHDGAALEWSEKVNRFVSICLASAQRESTPDGLRW